MMGLGAAVMGHMPQCHQGLHPLRVRLRPDRCLQVSQALLLPGSLAKPQTNPIRMLRRPAAISQLAVASVATTAGSCILALASSMAECFRGYKALASADGPIVDLARSVLMPVSHASSYAKTDITDGLSKQCCPGT